MIYLDGPDVKERYSCVYCQVLHGVVVAKKRPTEQKEWVAVAKFPLFLLSRESR